MNEPERVHFKIALPVELKQRLEHHAVENRRSLSAEIIHRLTTTLEMDEYEPSDNAHGDSESRTSVWTISPDLFQRVLDSLNKIEESVAEPKLAETIQNSVDVSLKEAGKKYGLLMGDPDKNKP